MRQPLPTCAAANSNTKRLVNKSTYKNENAKFSPIESLMTVLGYGKTIWTKVNNLPLLEALPLIDLTFLLEEHIQNLYELCKFETSFPPDFDGSIIPDLFEFYNKQELSRQSNKRGHSLREVFLAQVTQGKSSNNSTSVNYYEPLEEQEDIRCEEYTIHTIKQVNKPIKPTMKVSDSATQASFPEDLDIAEVATSIRHRQTTTAMDEDTDDDPHSNPLPNIRQESLQLQPPMSLLQAIYVLISSGTKTL